MLLPLFSWITVHPADILIILIVLALSIYGIWYAFKNRKNGCGGCSGCQYGGDCSRCHHKTK